MKQAIDLPAVQALLQHGINSGYWTIEQLDLISQECERNLITEVYLENAADLIVTVLGINKKAELVAALSQRLNIE